MWHTSKLMESPAWRLRSINARRVIDFLEIDHMAHAGTENGHLMATYDQLAEFGVPRSEIRGAIEELEFLGLIRWERGGRWAGTNQPSKFRLTYYADRNHNSATNEWKGKTEEAIRVWRKNRAHLKSVRKKK